MPLANTLLPGAGVVALGVGRAGKSLCSKLQGVAPNRELLGCLVVQPADVFLNDSILFVESLNPIVFDSEK